MEKQIEIKVMYFDEETCTRCMSTISILEEAINTFKESYPNASINYVKTKVGEKQIEISPTILINNIDLETLIINNAAVKKVSKCEDCSCIAQKSVCCRDYKEGVIDKEAINKVLISQI